MSDQQPPRDPFDGASTNGDVEPPRNPYEPTAGSAPTPPGPPPGPTPGAPAYGAPTPTPTGQPYGQPGAPTPAPMPTGQPSGALPPPYDPQNPYAQRGDAMGHPGPGGQVLPGFAAGAYASWISRVGAYLIDGLIAGVAGLPAMVAYLTWLVPAINTATVDPVTGQLQITEPPSAVDVGLIVVGLVLSWAVAIWNQIFRQGRTGQSIGKSMLGIELLSEQSQQPIGALMTFLRMLVHYLDALPCYLGFLWPLWHDKRQTWADMILKTVVVKKVR